MDYVVNSDENYDLDYQPSPSSEDLYDQSTSPTPAKSSPSGYSISYFRTDSEISAFSESMDANSCSSEPGSNNTVFHVKQGTKENKHVVDNNLDDQEPLDSELETMKQRFAKLLLGEDMSGSGKGVCTAVTISNAITNLYATVFGQNLRLEPLDQVKKTMWKREMDCLLSVCNYMVDFFPKSKTLPDETTVEVMTSRPRSDISIYLPALQKLDAMLLDILDSFHDMEFWYAEKGAVTSHSNGSRHGSFRRVSLQKEEKWWLPIPCVPLAGLSSKSRNHLINKCEYTSQIHKAVMAINSTILDEMEIPNTYLETLPKSAKASLGEKIYRYMSTSEKFSAENLLDRLNIASEYEALELADRVESSMYTWRRKACLIHSKSSWKSVKDFVYNSDRSDKNIDLAERAESLILCLKQKFPELSQTTLDASKIEYNKDVGKAILESYSRVLEGLSFNIVAWIESVLYADKSMRNQND